MRDEPEAYIGDVGDAANESRGRFRQVRGDEGGGHHGRTLSRLRPSVSRCREGGLSAPRGPERAARGGGGRAGCGVGGAARPGPSMAGVRVIFVEPSFPRNQRQFVRGLAEAGAEVIGIGESPQDFLDDEVKSWLVHYSQVGSVVDVDEMTSAVRWGPGRAWGT